MMPIFEELFLLSLDDEKGRPVASAKTRLVYALPGAMLADLALRGKIQAAEKRRLEVVDGSGCGDEILDRVLETIRASGSARKFSYWISELSARPKKLREQLTERLIAEGLLLQDDQQSADAEQVATEPKMPVKTKVELKNQLRALVLAGSTEALDDHSLALLDVARAGKLLNVIFTEDEINLAERVIREIVLRAALDRPALQIIEEIVDAVTVRIDDPED